MSEFVLPPPSPLAIREELESAIIRDLLGPAGGPEEEVDETSVRERYLVGVLASRRQRLELETFDELAIGGENSAEEGTTDVGAPQTPTMFPSSFGMTFGVAGTATALQITARWGFYDRLPSEAPASGQGGNPKRVWRRRPIEGVSPTLPLAEGPLTWTVTDEFPDVTVQGLVRRQDDEWIVTLFLVNGQEEPKQLRDRAWLFQPELIAEAPDGSPIFRKRILAHDPARWDAEDRALAMLYRRHVEFAAGHGVGVHAELSPGITERAVRIMTQVVPTAEVPQVAAPTVDEVPALADTVLDMKTLAGTATGDLSGALSPLADAYATWIARETGRIGEPAAG